MCGIFAAMTKRPLTNDSVRAALDVLYHRGPDGSGRWQSADRCWTLGHTRLSIIGLQNGDQPLHSPDGQVHMVVNGEFYDYRAIRDQLRADGFRFATESDSEIALHLYQQQGMRATQSLRGEFAGVIADEREGVMIGFRDRFGIKPLHYAVINGEVFFASEIKALLALGVPAAWDPDPVCLQSTGRCHEFTMFANIRSIPPGNYAIAKNGEVRIYPYWDWDYPLASELRADTRSEEEIVSDFRASLLDAVQQRLVADVEVASYLSGGIDSCAVLGLAQKDMDRPIRAFTLTFDHALYDESKVAEAQAKFVGAEFCPIPITGREIADAYSDAVWHAETAMFNGHGVAKFLLSRAVRDAGIKVVFTGEGADELLGGYPFFRTDAVLHNPDFTESQKKAAIEEMFAANEASRAVMMPAHVDDPALEAVRGRLGWIPSACRVFANMGRSVDPYLYDGVMQRSRQSNPFVELLDRLPIGQRLAGRDPLNQALYLNSKQNLPNMILTYLGDRMEMAHSVEGRVPFLDHNVAETAARIPVNMKVKGIREKHVLREAARDVLIPEVYNRQKHPFQSPPTQKADDPLIDFYRDTFASTAAKTQPFFDMKKVSGLMDQLLTCPYDERIALEGRIQRIASIVIMQERFGMSQMASAA